MSHENRDYSYKIITKFSSPPSPLHLWRGEQMPLTTGSKENFYGTRLQFFVASAVASHSSTAGTLVKACLAHSELYSSTSSSYPSP